MCNADIKPENLLIRLDDVLKLCDFGQSLSLFRHTLHVLI